MSLYSNVSIGADYLLLSIVIENRFEELLTSSPTPLNEDSRYRFHFLNVFPRDCLAIYYYSLGFPVSHISMTPVSMQEKFFMALALGLPSIFRSDTKFLSNNFIKTGIRQVPPIIIALSGFTISHTKI